MEKRLFIPQNMMETWIADGKVTFQDNILTLVQENASYQVSPAVHILSLIDGQDQVGLVGRVCTVAELQAMGAENYRDSVILKDTAYQGEEGFSGILQEEKSVFGVSTPKAATLAPTTKPAVLVSTKPSVQTAEKSAAAPAKPPEAKSENQEQTKQDADTKLLTDFLLKHL